MGPKNLGQILVYLLQIAMFFNDAHRNRRVTYTLEWVSWKGSVDTKESYFKNMRDQR